MGRYPLNVFCDSLSNDLQGPEMVVLPGGTFVMGSDKYLFFHFVDELLKRTTSVGKFITLTPRYDEGPQHSVHIKSFALAKFPVTVREYLAYVKATNNGYPEWLQAQGQPSHFFRALYNKFALKDYEALGSALRGENYPVVGISWLDAVGYTNWLTDNTGRNYRLPTEAEWEYAARAGTQTAYWWGDAIEYDRANFLGCSIREKYKTISPKGTFLPNPFGLEDMLGNISEWTCSRYEESYKGQEEEYQRSGDVTRDFFLPKKFIAIRGGACWSLPFQIRCASRGGGRLYSYRNYSIGFRIAADL